MKTSKEILNEIKILNNKFWNLPDNTSDIIFDELENQIEKLKKERDLLLEKEFDSKISIIKLSEWEQNFIKSFSICKSKQISKKQSEIFERFLKHYNTKENYSSFHSKTYVSCQEYNGKYNGLIYELKSFSNFSYITIRKEK